MFSHGASDCSSSIGSWPCRRRPRLPNFSVPNSAGPSSSGNAQPRNSWPEYSNRSPPCAQRQPPMAKYLGAIDQGTTSTRFIVFDPSGRMLACEQQEHRQICPKPGWVEHDPEEIWQRSQEVIARAMQGRGLQPADFAAIGITNQRETTILWERGTGRPVHPAIVWQDTRVADLVGEFSKQGGQNRFRERTGLPLSTYFSSLKVLWLLENVPGLSQRAEAGEVLFGNVDSFLVWQLTGGPKGGIHVTDVTNASRTQLMRLQTLQWDPDLLSAFAIPRVMLPRICSSSEIYGTASESTLQGVPIGGVLGDQQAALVGQACFATGEAKNTYGTGCFLLMNVGGRPVASRHGLLSTVAYQLAGQPAVYALEGSVAITGGAGAVDARQPRADRQERRSRNPCGQRGRQRRRILRARFFGTVRSLLETQRPRRDRRFDALRQQGPSGTGRAGSDRISDSRRAGSDGKRLGRGPGIPARRRRYGGEPPADAVPGRHSCQAGGTAHHPRDDGAGRRLRSRAGLRSLQEPRRPAPKLADGPDVAPELNHRSTRADVSTMEKGGNAVLRLGGVSPPRRSPSRVHVTGWARFPLELPVGMVPAPHRPSVSEGHVQSRRKHDVVLLLPDGRVRHIHVAEGILPAQPLVELRDRGQVEGGAVFARVLEIREEICALRDDGRLAKLVQKLVAGLCGGKAVDQVRQGRRLGVVFPSVVGAAQEIERRAGPLDHVDPEAAAEYRAQVQVLQSVGEEVGVHEPEQAGRDVAVIAGPAAVGVRRDPRGRGRQIVRGVHRGGVERELVVQAGANTVEGQGQVLGFAVAPGQPEADADASVPAFEQPGVLQFLPCFLFCMAAHYDNGVLRHLDPLAGLGGHVHLAAAAADRPDHRLAFLQAHVKRLL